MSSFLASDYNLKKEKEKNKTKDKTLKSTGSRRLLVCWLDLVYIKNPAGKDVFSEIQRTPQ